jgi:MOSC domain-containing protein YiiM
MLVPMPSPRVLSVRAGRTIDLVAGDPVRTAFRKHRIVGPVRVTREGIEGDEHAHAEVHGGPDRAVLAYPAAHYRAWAAASVAVDGFGENLVVDGLDEASVCIGDLYRVGTVLLEVSFPRTPCAMITRASGVQDLFERVRESDRTGWLHRVLEEGVLKEGDDVIACGRPNPTWTVSRAARVMARMRKLDPAAVDDARELATVAALVSGWREKLTKRADAAARGETRDPTLKD